MADQNKSSYPPCTRTETKNAAWTVSGSVWFTCPEHEKEVSKIVAKSHTDHEKERVNLAVELLEIHNRGTINRLSLFNDEGFEEI